MKAIKSKIFRFLLMKTLKLCDMALAMKDCADTQEEVNEIVSMRNYVVRELKNREEPSIGA